MKSYVSKTPLEKVLDAYNDGSFQKAHNRAIELVNDRPNDYKNWELLGVILIKLNKYDHALEALQKSADMSKEDASPYINLGVVFRILGQKENSVKAYKKALNINPNSTLGHNNLANVLRELNKFNEAEIHAKEAIKLDLNNAVAYSNLGLIQHELGNKYNEAKKNCERALQINPQFAEAHNNLGIILVEMGDSLGAKICFENALKFDSQLLESKLNLGGTLFNLNEVADAKKILFEVLAKDPENLRAKLGLAHIAITENRIQDGVNLYKEVATHNDDVVSLKARVALAILAYAYENFTYCSEQLLKAQPIFSISKISYKNESLYARYIYQLLEWHKNNETKITQEKEKVLLVIGESHSLSTVGMKPSLDGKLRVCKVKWIEGCKQWKLSNRDKNIWNQKLKLICNEIRVPVDILFTVGEIDCRYDQGIMKYSEKNPNKFISKIVVETIDGFLNFIHTLFDSNARRIIIQGVPYPKMTFPKCDPRRDKHMKLVKDFNIELKMRSHVYGFGFLDVYEMTRPDNFKYSDKWHIDDVHLKPDYIVEAFKHHLSYEP